MNPDSIQLDRCLDALARLEGELGAKLDEFCDGILASDAAHARRELWAWCAFVAVATSGLTVIVALVAPLR